MQVFYDKIKEASDLLFPTLEGGIHWGFAKLSEKEEFKPYLVLKPGENSVDMEDTGNETVEIRAILFQFYGNGLLFVSSLVDSAYNAFRKYVSILSNGDKILSATKFSEDTFLDPDRDGDATEIWTGILTMDFYVQRKVGEA